jgi:regulator of protease activity HflC (stomatin/prohibitin superfamily)
MFREMIKKNERGLLYKDGDYIRCLKPGKYFFNPLIDYHVQKMDVTLPFEPYENLNLFLKDEELKKELTIVDVKDHEIAIHFEDGKLVEVLTPGKYAYWNVLVKHEFLIIDKRNPEIDSKIDASVYRHPLLEEHVEQFEVMSYEKGVLFFDNQVQRILEPGRYAFWKGPVEVKLQCVDLRQQQIDITGQEMMTKDKISLRLNFVCQYHVTEPKRVLEIKSFDEQLYIVLQLVLREYVGTLKLDELLKNKQEVGQYVLQKLKEKEREFGVAFTFAGLKDIILPGDIKEILNTVLIAEKQAQANVITRREETASTRSLLNTAKLMEQNKTLYRLKELEFLEKICDKIGHISLTSGDNLLEQLNTLLSKKEQ